MLAVKAEYENGQVKWLEKPPMERHSNVIVVFEDDVPADLSAREWSANSLRTAMRGMEDEPTEYTESDIKERV